MKTETFRAIEQQHSSYVPSDEAQEVLRTSGLITFTGQVAGAGKDSIKEGVAAVLGGVVCPSVTTRDQRPSDNNDYRYASEPEFLDMVRSGRLIEFEPLRKSYFYATDSVDVRRITSIGRVPFKDLEVAGLLKLRQIAETDGLIKAIYPLPDLSIVEGDMTGWEKMLTERDYEGARFLQVLQGELGLEKREDLRARLVAAKGQLREVTNARLTAQPGTFFPTNRYGKLDETVEESVRLLTETREDPIARFAYSNNVKQALLGLQRLATEFLAASA